MIIKTEIHNIVNTMFELFLDANNINIPHIIPSINNSITDNDVFSSDPETLWIHELSIESSKIKICKLQC